MAQSQSEDTLSDEMAELVDAPSSLDEDEVRQFVIEALKEIRSELESNFEEAKVMTDRFDEDSPRVDEILDPENIENITVRSEDFRNPQIRVWLKGTRPIWANHAWRDTIYPHGLNAHNGKVTTTFDVRPF